MGRHCGSCPHSALMRPFCQLAFLPHGGFPLPIHPITHWPSLPLISLFQSVFFFVDKVGWYVDDDMAEVSAQSCLSLGKPKLQNWSGREEGLMRTLHHPRREDWQHCPGKDWKSFHLSFFLAFGFLSHFWVSFLLLGFFLTFGFLSYFCNLL